jgi:hypothetical protein
MSKLLTKEFYNLFLENLKEKVVSGNVVSVKNEDGTFTASVPFYTLTDFCKANEIDFEETLKSMKLEKSIGSYSVNDFAKLDKEYTYGTDTAGIQVEVILDEYMRQQIIMRLNKNAIWRKLVARTIPVGSMDVRVPYQERIEDAMVKLLNTAEGTALPKLDALKFNSEVLSLGKVGGEIEFTYEVLKSAQINLISVHYQAVATAYDLTKDANIINVLKNGHSVDATKGANGRGGAIKTVIPAISVQNILPVKEYFKQYGIELEYAVMNLNTLRNILGIEEFSTPLLYDTAISGKLTQFIGFDVLITDKLADNEILAVDAGKAVEEYVFTPFSSESDKDIHKQTFSKTFYEISGFALINPNAATLITVNAEAEFALPNIDAE